MSKDKMIFPEDVVLKQVNIPLYEATEMSEELKLCLFCGSKQKQIAELEAERDHFREVAEKLVWLYSDEHQERLDNGLRIDGFYSHEWLGMILDMARDAMKGAEK